MMRLNLLKKNIRLVMLLAAIALCAVAYERGFVSPKYVRAFHTKCVRVQSLLMDAYGSSARRFSDSIADRLRHGRRAGKQPRGKSYQPERQVSEQNRPAAYEVITPDMLYCPEPPVPSKTAVPAADAPLRALPVRQSMKARRIGKIDRNPVSHGSRSGNMIALTFDSGQVGGSRAAFHAILDHLIHRRIPATFFLTGDFMETYPDIARTIARTSFFEMGNHTRHHPDLTGMSNAAICEEITRTQIIMEKITGRSGVLFRPPFGKTDDRVAQIAADAGLRTVLWDVATDDYAPGIRGEDIKRMVLTGVRSGSIVLLHMNGESKATGEVMPDIVAQLKKKGFRFVTVSTILCSRSFRVSEAGERF